MFKKIAWNVSKVLMAIVGFIPFSFSLALITVNPLLALGIGALSFPVLALPAVNLGTRFLSRNYIEDSAFMVYRDKKNKVDGKTYDSIEQDISQYSQFFRARTVGKYGKGMYFLVQLINLFQQLPRERNGEVITYSLRSHETTIELLNILNKMGFIENLTDIDRKVDMNNGSDVKRGTSNLFIEKFMFGNNKKDDEEKIMYNMSFTLSDKKFDINDCFDLLENKFKGRSIDKILKFLDSYDVVKKDNNFIFKKPLFRKKGKKCPEFLKIVQERIQLESQLKETQSNKELSDENGKGLDLSSINLVDEQKIQDKIDKIEEMKKQLVDAKMEILENSNENEEEVRIGSK